MLERLEQVESVATAYSNFTLEMFMPGFKLALKTAEVVVTLLTDVVIASGAFKVLGGVVNDMIVPLTPPLLTR